MMKTIDGQAYIRMIREGAARLRNHADEVNDLNVFPIPDGDTGENMALTIEGGARAETEEVSIGAVSAQVAKKMLMSARGNSGVILSQFFAGIADGLTDCAEADLDTVKNAYRSGVARAYKAVLTPTEGTILTVAKDATRFACETESESIDNFLRLFNEEARRSVARTPELLDVLKEAGVVDSGGTGLAYICEGMYDGLTGSTEEHTYTAPAPQPAASIDPDLFTEDTVFEYGYCTELLVRLQRSKTDIEHFDLEIISDYLQSIGNSVVCLKDGSIVKLHVHTFEPYKVLQYCQKFGEFLTVKIENMMLQHNEVVGREEEHAALKKYAVVTTSSGDGISAKFREFGADAIVEGGQTSNPSAEDFTKAFRTVHAKTIFVLPNNGNILLAAQQAAELFTEADVRVVPTKTIGDGYAVLSMLDFESDNTDTIYEGMLEAMDGVVTADISRSIRDTAMNGLNIRTGDYIGIIGKNIEAADADCVKAVCDTVNKMEPDEHSLLLLITGRDADPEITGRLMEKLTAEHPFLEVYSSEGGQAVYPYIMIAE